MDSFSGEENGSKEVHAPLFIRPMAERRAAWPRPQTRRAVSAYGFLFGRGKRIKGGSQPLFARPMAEHRVAWPRLQSRFDPRMCMCAPPPGYIGASTKRLEVECSGSIGGEERAQRRRSSLSRQWRIYGDGRWRGRSSKQAVQTGPDRRTGDGARSRGRGASCGVEQGRGGGLRGESSPESVWSRGHVERQMPGSGSSCYRDRAGSTR